MNAAKWIKLPVLLSNCEMKKLLGQLVTFHLFQVGCVVEADKAEICPKRFLEHYTTYLDQIQRGVEPKGHYFSLLWTKDESTLSHQLLADGRKIIRPVLPSIQLQPHHFQFDKSNYSCHSMVYGLDTIPWGIQFSYPHLFEDPKTRKIETVDNRFINTELFQTLRLFIKEHTRPTPLLVNGKKVNLPIRLGQECFTWIKNYPWLRNRGIDVAC